MQAINLELALRWCEIILLGCCAVHHQVYFICELAPLSNAVLVSIERPQKEWIFKVDGHTVKEFIL